MESLSTTVNILNNTRKYILYINYIIVFCGFIGHILNILVLTQLRLFQGNRWAFYLIIDSVVNIVFSLVQSSNTILQTISGNDSQGNILVWCRMRSVLFQTCTLLSSFTICFAACDQFFSTSYRLNMRQMCTLKLAQSLIFVGGWICLLHSIIFGLFLNVPSSLGCVITNPILTEYASWFYYPVLYGPLPIVIASLSSLLAFRNVRRIIRQQVPIVRRRLDQQMTAMILMRVLSYVIFSLPYSVYRIYAINVPSPQSNVLQYAIRQLLQVFFTTWNGVNFAV
jgi:hypothetical protein